MTVLVRPQSHFDLIAERYPEHPELELFRDRAYRLSNLYYIKDPYGRRVKFRPNWAQLELLEDLHTCEIVLKCRQIGMTTVFNLILLDQVLAYPNSNAGIIAQTLDDTTHIFRDRIKFAYDNLDPRLKALFPTVGDSAKELSFKHGSSIRVGTSLRSSTLQMLHVSEFGKICAKDPERAKEIITGSLNTVHVGQNIFIESTAEGREGYFFEMCQDAEARAKRGDRLGELDFRFRFFPWWRHKEYALDGIEDCPEQLKEYWDRCAIKGLKLSPEQKTWYIKKWQIQREDMTREYPSFPEEAFAASQDGYWYAGEMRALHEAGHITRVSYDKGLPVHTAWDLGQADFQCIIFFQITRQGEINIIDYFRKPNTDLALTVAMLQSKGYVYGKHIWPHDANSRDRAGITFVRQAGELGLKGLVLENADKRDGIRLVRTTLGKCWFDEKKSKQLVNDLENYKKKWSNAIGGWTGEPAHDEASHGADAMRYLCAGLHLIQGSKGSMESDAQATRKFFGG